MLTIMACTNSAAEKNTNITVAASEVETAGSIVGSWTPMGFDFNLDGKTEPSGKWITQDDKKRAEDIKATGLPADVADFTFKANGKGYISAKDTKETEFAYTKMANGKYVTKGTVDDDEPKNTNAENIEEFYLDKEGRLIFHHTSKPKLMGKYVIQNSFELYKKK